jgi:hypothetical protein
MRTLLRATLVLLSGTVLVSSALAEELAWHDSTRDVYVDGRLDRAVQVLSAEMGKKLAVLHPDESRNGVRSPLATLRVRSPLATLMIACR